jgi:hypothetical protein
MVFTEELSFISDGDFYALNITDRVREVLKASGIMDPQAVYDNLKMVLPHFP